MKNPCQSQDNQTYAAVLDMWANLYSINDIADELDVTPKTVEYHVKRARDNGDQRAVRPWPNKYAAMRDIRTGIIIKRTAEGFSTTQIAIELGCKPRLVQRRLKEMRAA